MADLMLARTDLRNRAVDADAVLSRAGAPEGPDGDALQAVREIIAAVRARGDGALRELTERFDGCRIDRFRVSDDELEAAPGAIPGDVRDALEFAKHQIHAYHRLQTPPEVRIVNEGIAAREIVRSEEHTSELQSHVNLVC